MKVDVTQEIILNYSIHPVGVALYNATRKESGIYKDWMSIGRDKYAMSDNLIAWYNTHKRKPIAVWIDDVEKTVVIHGDHCDQTFGNKKLNSDAYYKFCV